MKRRGLLRGSMLLGAALSLAALVQGCDGRSPFGAQGKKEPLTGPALVELNLSKGVAERGASSLFGSIPGTGHVDLIRTIRELDPTDTKGVFVRLGTTHVGFAVALEAGRLLKGLKDRNIPVYCHADGLDNSTMLLVANGCSEVWLSPAGGVDTVGIAFSLMFGKKLLEDLGVGVDFLQIGKYKGAQEPYTRNDPSPEARESLEGTVRDLRKAWIDGVTEGRGKAVEAALEDGPHTADAAKALGLIDRIGFADEARESAKNAVDAERTVVSFGGGQANEGGGFSEMLRALSGADAEGAPHVAVVRAIGAITMSGGGALGGDGITESGLGKVLVQLTEDDAVKAVVLRIDSPGGSALASDLLWHKLMKLREKKPLIISVGGMAASGGYYLASSGSRIFAEPTSILGSIGVVGGKFALGGPLQKIGVSTVTISGAPDATRAARASYLSPFDRWDEPTKEKVRVSMQSIYDTFIQRVVEGRGIDKDTVSASAEGRIYGGSSALERRMIDQLGGLDDAIEYAKGQAGLGADGKIRVRDQVPGLLELLGGGGGDEASAANAMALAAAEQAKRELDPWTKLTAALPEEARVWMSAASPMSEGESAVLVLPYALTLR